MYVYIFIYTFTTFFKGYLYFLHTKDPGISFKSAVTSLPSTAAARAFDAPKSFQ